MKKKMRISISLFIVIFIVGIIIFMQMTRIQYSKEFIYLPEVKGMKVEQCQKSKTNGFNKITYIMENGNYDNFLIKYKKLLEKDGWRIADDKIPENIEAKKYEHVARINLIDLNENLKILIWTK